MSTLTQPATRSSSDVVRSVRADILSGTRKPGERVPLDGLKAALGVSLSPIREGLSQLVAEGLLVPAGQRGYRVAPVSVAEYQDIMARRVDLECMALAASIAHGGEDWEVALIAAFQRLKNFESKRWLVDQLGMWEQRHGVFHQTLISACGSPILLGFCAQLHDMADRYRRVLISTHEPDRNVTVEHQTMYEAALAHDAQQACAVLREHIERTGQTVLRMMGEPAAP